MGAIGIELLLAQVCAVAFFRAGRIESDGAACDYRFLWALMSALVLGVFKVAWLVLLLSQVGLFLGIGVYPALRDPIQ